MKRNTRKPLLSAVAGMLDRLLFGYMHKTGLLTCVAHADADSFTDNRYYISANLPVTYDAAGYADTDIIWTEITLVSEFPPYGAMSEVNRFTPIHGAIKKVKRTPDFGGGPMVYADLPSDAGQAIVLTASTSQAHYSIKVLNTDNELHYLDVIVTSCQLSKAASGDFKIRTAGVEVNKDPVIVAAA